MHSQYFILPTPCRIALDYLPRKNTPQSQPVVKRFNDVNFSVNHTYIFSSVTLAESGWFVNRANGFCVFEQATCSD